MCWLRLTLACQQFLLDSQPVVAQVSFRLGHGYLIDLGNVPGLRHTLLTEPGESCQTRFYKHVAPEGAESL